MKRSVYSTLLLVAGFIAGGCSDTQTAPRSPQGPSYSLTRAHGRSAFSFKGTVVSANGETVALNGGGSFDPATASNVIPSETSGHGEGGFSCVTDVTISPFGGCAQGEGTHWDSDQLLESSPFKCGGVANEQGKTAFTSANTIVLLAHFYRAGDGEDASFTAKMFVSDSDLAGDVPGNQNIWIQGFGCGTGDIKFNN
jgi:hypothetical protein